MPSWLLNCQDVTNIDELRDELLQTMDYTCPSQFNWEFQEQRDKIGIHKHESAQDWDQCHRKMSPHLHNRWSESTAINPEGFWHSAEIKR